MPKLLSQICETVIDVDNRHNEPSQCTCKKTSSGFLRLSARVVKSHHSVGRLWHVLLRCVSDVEDLLQSVPGVLFYRSICMCPSVKEGIPVSQVVSPANDDFVSRRKLEQIAADIGKWWPHLTSIIGTDQSTVLELYEKDSNPRFTQAAAPRILSERQILRNNR
ncbi:uncharacterized protein LOC134194778 isoform X2 [Corticium candelabrum]|uniref:uncharacterized protein LOC134194778 isoform X2 n=1 Tax=Corticium candelabrum TaxID=121492 RepID=UPI002E257DCD|nr:uncharacterized protein LOC134194778 isoform X2 [Corticium candelabrum]